MLRARADNPMQAEKPPRFRALLPWLVTALLLVALVAVLVSRLIVANQKVQTVAPRLTTHSIVGQSAPNVTLAPFNASQPPITLSTYRGHPVVLNFWASWCKPCQHEAPLLESTAKAYSARGVRFIGATEQSDPASATKFIQQYGITYLCGNDSTLSAATAYGVTGLPMTFFIDRSGRVTALMPGALTKTALNAEIHKLLAA